jgi:hypothetical protein
MRAKEYGSGLIKPSEEFFVAIFRLLGRDESKFGAKDGVCMPIGLSDG